MFDKYNNQKQLLEEKKELILVYGCRGRVHNGREMEQQAARAGNCSNSAQEVAGASKKWGEVISPQSSTVVMNISCQV